MKTEKEIEEMHRKIFGSRDKASDKEHWDYTLGGFREGARATQKDLLESASEGFEEWFKINCEKNELSEGYTKKIQFKSWQVAKLSSQKIIQEKDEEIRKLKEEVKNLIEEIAGEDI